nr:subclass B1 metallo-beta-lactamase [Prolixibacteraceae bacterium]
MKQMGFLFFGILFSSTVFSQSAATLVVDNDVLLHQIAPGFYVHESFTNTEQYGRYSSNGLLYIENGEALMIDTPDNPSKTEALYRYLADSMGIRVTLF